jgi:glyoxylase-like metal-dependent hydrolase (beta-lactamase superfamily II)
LIATVEYALERPPELAAALPLAAGIEWLRLPVPGGLRHINVWLLDDGDGCTLVDTGMNVPESRAAWEGPLQDVLRGRRLRRIVCTHHHPDHAGLVAWLAERHGAMVLMTAPEYELMRYLYATRDAAAELAVRLDEYASNGLPATDENRWILTGEGYLRVMSGMPPEVQILRPGDVLEAGGRRWDVMQLAGHTDGQLLLHDAGAGLLIAGDQVLPRISSNIGIYPERRDRDPLDSFLAGFERLAALGPGTLVLPSHGEVFRGLGVRLAQLRQHHEERLELLAGLLGEEPATAAEIALRAYRGGLDPLNRMLALGETLAHLRYLEVRGRTRVEAPAAGPRRYVAQRGG